MFSECSVSIDTFGQHSHACGGILGVCFAWHELDSMILMGPFELSMLYDIMPYVKFTFSRKKTFLNILSFVLDS